MNYVNSDSFGDVDADVGCIWSTSTDAPFNVGYKRVRIQYGKLLPHHAQSFARSLVLPHCGGGHLSFFLSLSLFHSHFLSLPSSFSLILPSASGLGGGASISSSSASQIVKRAWERREIEDGRRKRITNTRTRESLTPSWERSIPVSREKDEKRKIHRLGSWEEKVKRSWFHVGIVEVDEVVVWQREEWQMCRIGHVSTEQLR